jgi:shikimate kinase
MAAMEQLRAFHNLALIGFMGTGKSSVGRLIAERLRFEFVDTDDCIEARAGKPITQIFAEDGEAAFREQERELIRTFENRTQVVIATGGGLAANPGCLDSLKSHALVVCLWASPDTIWNRVRHQTHRPLLQTAEPKERIRLLLADRQRFYRQADILLNTEWRSPRQLAQVVVHQFSFTSRQLRQDGD